MIEPKIIFEIASNDPAGLSMDEVIIVFQLAYVLDQNRNIMPKYEGKDLNEIWAGFKFNKRFTIDCFNTAPKKRKKKYVSKTR